MDFFGGTRGIQLSEEYEKNKIDVMSDQSEAMKEFAREKKSANKLKDIAAEIDSLNAKQE